MSLFSSKPYVAILLGLACTGTVSSVFAEDDPRLNAAFQDHIAYVATFAIPVVIEKCSATRKHYLQDVAPLYFQFVNTHQDRIERGRMLTLSELKPDDTLQAYRQRVLASRLGRLETGTREERQRVCDGVAAMLRNTLAGQPMPGEWPSRD